MTQEIRKRVEYSPDPAILAKQVGDLARDLLKIRDAAVARDGSAGELLAALDVGGHDVQKVQTLGFGDAPHEARIVNGLLTVDWRLGPLAEVLLTENVTAVQFLDPPGIGIQRLRVKQDSAGGRTMAGYPANVTWPAGAPPAITVAVDAVDRLDWVYDATTYDGRFDQNLS